MEKIRKREKVMKYIVYNEFIAIIISLYFTSISVWGTTWDFFTKYKKEHTVAFIFVVIFLAIKQFCGIMVRNWENLRYNLSEGQSLLTTALVSAKIIRFQDKSKEVKVTGDTFNRITKPKKQINMTLGEIDRFLDTKFNIKQEHICSTILYKNSSTDKWEYVFNSQGWTHTDPNSILKEENSLGLKCLLNNEHKFIPCKNTASKNDIFFLSQRDKDHGCGSAFFYPHKVCMPDGEDTYLISIITYGECLCKPNDNRSAHMISHAFLNICLRVSLELTLLSIQCWKYKMKNDTTRNGGATCRS